MPWQALTANASDSTLCFSLPTSALESAPSTTGFEMPDTAASGWDTEVNSFWATQMGASGLSGAGTGGTGSTGTGTGIGSTGTMTGTTGQPGPASAARGQ